ncbi:hypothetical protein [Alteribacillus iranensis]|nr:hypothetical protein [Alteribacillus iranensis]
METTNKKQHYGKLEMILWSIALPGFAQLSMGSYIKGVLFVGLEIAINVMANLNHVILLSFHGHIQEAVHQTNYQWLMFYPCLYLFAIWDAYKHSDGDEERFAFLPFVTTAYVMTVGVIYSPIFTISGHLIGPVWLPILSAPVGILLGLFIRRVLLNIEKQSIKG